MQHILLKVKFTITCNNKRKRICVIGTVMYPKDKFGFKMMGEVIMRY